MDKVQKNEWILTYIKEIVDLKYVCINSFCKSNIQLPISNQDKRMKRNNSQTSYRSLYFTTEIYYVVI